MTLANKAKHLQKFNHLVNQVSNWFIHSSANTSRNYKTVFARHSSFFHYHQCNSEFRDGLHKHTARPCVWCRPNEKGANWHDTGFKHVNRLCHRVVKRQQRSNDTEFTQSKVWPADCGPAWKTPGIVWLTKSKKFNTALDFYECQMCALFDMTLPLTEKSLKRGYWKTFHFLSW